MGRGLFVAVGTAAVALLALIMFSMYTFAVLIEHRLDHLLVLGRWLPMPTIVMIATTRMIEAALTSGAFCFGSICLIPVCLSINLCFIGDGISLIKRDY